jgi:hypothetical protein
MGHHMEMDLNTSFHCSLAYSALASFRIEMSGSSLRQPNPAQQVGVAGIGAQAVELGINL